MRASGTHPRLPTIRSIGAIMLALLGVLVLGVPAAIGPGAITLAATTALINGASGLPKPADKPGYIFGVADHLLAPNTFCNAITNPACNLVPVNGPETIWPFIGGLGGLTFDKSVAEGLYNLNLSYQAVRTLDPNGKIVIFGYSQSGDIVTKQLRAIAADPSKPAFDQLEFLIVGNTNRPNGGLLSRLTPLYIPIFNASFDGPTPIDTGYQGTDIAFHYDGIADFPLYPLNLLATVNALFGFLTIHPTYPAPNPALGEYTQTQYQEAIADPKNRQIAGGTTFVSLPITNLPILHPLRSLAAKTGTTYFIEPLLDLIEPALTVLIELGYDRTIPYGQFTTAGLFPIINPFKLAFDLVVAAVQGVTQAIQDLRAPTAPTAELVQSNPFPFLNLNPFTDPYVGVSPAAAALSSAPPAEASRTSGAAKMVDDTVDDAKLLKTTDTLVTEDIPPTDDPVVTDPVITEPVIDEPLVDHDTPPTVLKTDDTPRELPVRSGAVSATPGAVTGHPIASVDAQPSPPVTLNGVTTSSPAVSLPQSSVPATSPGADAGLTGIPTSLTGSPTKDKDTTAGDNTPASPANG